MIKVGISIACFNVVDQVVNCIKYLEKSINVELFICVVDDGSTDGTSEIVESNFPNIKIIKGNGNLWWAEATNIGMKHCIDNGCEYVIMLNPDVEVLNNTIYELVLESQKHNDAIVSPVVIDSENRDTIMEAGHKWGKVSRYLPFIYSLKYLFKKGTKINNVPLNSFKTVTVSGRGGLLSKKAINTLGYLDSKIFPQYGGDTDYALRANNINFPMYTTKRALVYLNVSNSGMDVTKFKSEKLKGFNQYLFNIKNGDAVRVLYKLYTRNLPFYFALPTYIFSLTLGSFRYWQQAYNKKMA